MGYQTVLFDMDGTLLDTLGDLHASVNAILRELERPERTLDEVRAFVGNGAEALLRRAMPEGSSDAEITDALARYQAYYEAHCQELTKPYDGVLAALEALKAAGKRLAVVSNKSDAAVGILNEQYFKGLCDVAIGDAPGRRRKPWPDAAEAALRALGASKDGAVYVGDSEVDVETARNAGLPLVAVGWGFRGRRALEAAGAAVIVDTPAELLAKLI